jgi:hypothetical protein
LYHIHIYLYRTTGTLHLRRYNQAPKSLLREKCTRARYFTTSYDLVDYHLSAAFVLV